MVAGRKEIQVRLSIAGPLQPVTWDEKKIAQVLNNLTSNAMKFSNPGTTIDVRAVSEGGFVTISVTDEGPGIPECERGKLFQPFGRTSVCSTAGEDSTGLGLVIVRKIVEGHGGRIWLQSQVGVGSVFSFALPAYAK